MTCWSCSYQSNLSSTLPFFSQSSCSPAKMKLSKPLTYHPLLSGHLFEAGKVAMFLWCPYRGTNDCDKCQLCLEFLYGHGVTSVIETSAGNEARRTELCFFNCIQVTAVASMRRTEALASVKFYQILSIFIFFIRLIILEDFIRLISYNGPCVRLGCSFFLATALQVLK